MSKAPTFDPRPVTDDLLHAFIDDLTAIVQNTVTVEHNPKYIRVVVHYGGQPSAYAFIERKTCNLYKPASWKGPILNVVRGAIHDNSWRVWTGRYGIHSAV